MSDNSTNGVREAPFIMVTGKKTNRTFREKVLPLVRQDATLSEDAQIRPASQHPDVKEGDTKHNESKEA